jgi:hypothetical protein
VSARTSAHPHAPTSGAAAHAVSAPAEPRGWIRPGHVDTLGAALVIAGVVIASCSLASLAVLALVALVPWSHFRPRYQRGVGAGERPPAAVLALGRSVLEVRDAVGRRLAGGRPVSRHPRGARHLLPLGR